MGDLPERRRLQPGLGLDSRLSKWFEFPDPNDDIDPFGLFNEVTTEKEIVAFHESGHIVLCHLLNVTITRAAIQIGEGNWKGGTSHFQAGTVKQEIMISPVGQILSVTSAGFQL